MAKTCLYLILDRFHRHLILWNVLRQIYTSRVQTTTEKKVSQIVWHHHPTPNWPSFKPCHNKTKSEKKYIVSKGAFYFLQSHLFPLNCHDGPESGMLRSFITTRTESSAWHNWAPSCCALCVRARAHTLITISTNSRRVWDLVKIRNNIM